MSHQGTAAHLLPRRDDFAAVRQQDVHRVAIHRRIRHILHATREQANAVTARALRRFSLRYQIERKPIANLRLERV